MKILVTGHLGVIGRDLMVHLAEDGHTLRGYDIADGNDILNLDSLITACHEQNAVIHLAAIPAPRPDKSFADYFKINVQGTLNVCEACKEAKVPRLVFMSSQACYGFYGGRGYGTSKRMCEEMIGWYAGANRSEPLGATFEDAPKYFSAVVLRLTGYRATVSPATMLKAIDVALRSSESYLVLDVTDSETKAPYEGLKTAQKIEAM